MSTFTFEPNEAAQHLERAAGARVPLFHLRQGFMALQRMADMLSAYGAAEAYEPVPFGANHRLIAALVEVVAIVPVCVTCSFDECRTCYGAALRFASLLNKSSDILSELQREKILSAFARHIGEIATDLDGVYERVRLEFLAGDRPELGRGERGSGLHGSSSALSSPGTGTPRAGQR